MIPIGDNAQTRGLPWVTWALILVNIGVFAYMLVVPSGVPADPATAQADFVEQTNNECYGFQTAPTDLDRFYCEWAFQPREFFDTASRESQAEEPDPTIVWLTLLTSMFIHAGWLHIGGNMLFLWVFGDNIEDRLGRIPYLLFYLASGIAATFTQAAIDSDSVIPQVGASGAVAGVLGAYLLWFPRASVRVVIPLFFVIVPTSVPAVLMIGLWFVQNFLAGVASLGTDTASSGGVAVFAHLGGFIFGLLVALAFFRRRPKRPRPPPPDPYIRMRY